jgi:hypothetical protein
MKPKRDDSALPENAVWADDGTDPVADAEWLASFQYTNRHYRLYDRYDDLRFLNGHPGNRILAGVVLIDGDEIEISHAGVFFPSPSMLGHLDSLSGRNPPRNPESPLETYSESGGSRDAYRFGSDVGFRLHQFQITQTKMRWRLVRSLPPGY